MDLPQLETFLAVTEEKSFSRAAARLHRSQPAVSQTIRKLEDELGEVLLDRTSREGTLTASGEVLAGYARKLLNLRVEAQGALDELRSLQSGRLKLAANEYTTLFLLPLIKSFRTLSPQISVAVQREMGSRIPSAVQSHAVEFGIITYRPDDPQLRSVVVFRDELAFVVNRRHPLAKVDEVSIQQLGAENFVAHNVPSPLRVKVLQAFQRHRTPLNMGIELPSMEAVKRCVEMGQGVALLPGLAAQQEIEAGRLVRVRVRELQFESRIRLVHRRDAVMSHAGAAFLKVVESCAREQKEPFLYQAEK